MISRCIDLFRATRFLCYNYKLRGITYIKIQDIEECHLRDVSTNFEYGGKFIRR